MKKLFTLFPTLGFVLPMVAQTSQFYSYTVNTIDGQPYPLMQLQGKKVMVVNVDVKPELAPQYAILDELYTQYCDSNFTILAFPSNNFDPLSASQQAANPGYRIMDFDVSFPVMAQVSVAGLNIAPLYQWLTQKSLNGVADAPVTGNFQKFLINEQGAWVGVETPNESAFNVRVLNWIWGKGYVK